MSGLGAHELLLYAALVAAGVMAGFVNTLAGGGSLLALPILMLLGLPANIANATNRLSIVAQSLSGATAFHRAGKLPGRAIVPVAGPTVAGALCGSAIAAVAPADVLKPVLLGAMVAMAIVLAVKPDVVTAREGEAPRSPLAHPPSLLGLFLAGVYGGFAQAGVGFVLLAVLGGLLRYDAVRANALKAVCTLWFGAAALAVFAAAGQVRWAPAAVLAVGTVIGAQLAVRFAIDANPKVLRGILLGAVLATCGAALLKT